MNKVEVVAAVIQKDNKIFCAQRNLFKSMGGKWEFPGGKIEIGETREEALVREIKEELDSDIVVDKYLMTVEHDYPTFHITMHAYLGTLVKGELTLKEHNDSVWLSKEELLSLDWADADKPIVDKIRSDINV
jgi:8-oxo-dGTP diphosphatase